MQFVIYVEDFTSPPDAVGMHWRYVCYESSLSKTSLTTTLNKSPTSDRFEQSEKFTLYTNTQLQISTLTRLCKLLKRPFDTYGYEFHSHEPHHELRAQIGKTLSLKMVILKKLSFQYSVSLIF